MLSRVRLERAKRQLKHKSMVTVPSAFSVPAAAMAAASALGTVSVESREAGGSFCPQPSQYRPSFFSTDY